ncbi:MAG: YciI family protein, partial [Streptosporangiaceae bacterium]
QMKYLMLMWGEVDATTGGEADFQAWADFDEQVKAAGAFVTNGALQPAASHAQVVLTQISGHALPDAAEHRPFIAGARQIQAFYLMECDSIEAAVKWASRLPTYGEVEVRELIEF